MILKYVNVPYAHMGLVYRNGQLKRVLEPGNHWLLGLPWSLKVEILSEKEPRMLTAELDQLKESGLVRNHAQFLELSQSERAIVWVDGRIEAVLGPGRYGYWTRLRKVKVEVLQAEDLILERPDLESILALPDIAKLLQVVDLKEGQAGVLYVNGAYRAVLKPGRYAIWTRVAQTRVYPVEVREQVLEILGQEIMTRDKVTLRINALLTYRVVDPQQAVEKTADIVQALYREGQVALRAEVSGVSLETLLAQKTALADAAQARLRALAKASGVKVIGLNIRDIILPGEMKTLLNQVIEAEKAAEANVIRRREETAAMRSQMNTAKLMAGNPVLMRLRELEVVEAVAKTTNLSVVAGEKGLADRLTKLI